VATRLQRVLDAAQPLARFGGDEFAVLAELRDEREAAALAQRLSGAHRASDLASGR
jgi:GGDEF domain-containing protein